MQHWVITQKYKEGIVSVCLIGMPLLDYEKVPCDKMKVHKRHKTSQTDTILALLAMNVIKNFSKIVNIVFIKSKRICQSNLN